MPGNPMSWVIGVLLVADLAAVQKGDPAARAERTGTQLKIKSENASADVEISVYEDRTTVSAQVMYGGW
ncbi:MAG: hypothetical protein IPL40_05185 [Proteobacteria bacterium]|nr:hypothetical protein [Pseudomonadota bacterium]